MLVTYVYFLFILSHYDCSTGNISHINLCTWGPFISSVLLVLYMLVTNIGRALLIFSLVLMVSITTFPEMSLFCLFYCIITSNCFYNYFSDVLKSCCGTRENNIQVKHSRVWVYKERNGYTDTCIVLGMGTEKSCNPSE